MKPSHCFIGVVVVWLISVISLISSLIPVSHPAPEPPTPHSLSFAEITARLTPPVDHVEGDFQHGNLNGDDYGYREALLSKGTTPQSPTTLHDLHGDPFRGRDCGGDGATKAGTKTGDYCMTSEQCPEDHYCHPIKAFCKPFCNSVEEATQRDDREHQCDACFKKCPYVQNLDCFRFDQRGGKCDKHKAMDECPNCKPVCNAGVPSRSKADVPHPDDVWITSYPKTGSTWVRHLVSNLYRASNKETQKGPTSFAEVDTLIPFLEDRTSWTSKTMFYDTPAPRVFKSHHPWQCDTFPCDNVVGSMASSQCMCPQCAQHYKRVIYVYRNGQETLASYFRFRKGLGHVKNGDHFGKFANQQRMYPGLSWADHVRSWKYAAKIGSAEVLWIAYEDLLKDPVAQMTRIAKFLRMKVSPDELSFAIDASSKDTMKKMEKEAGGLSFFKKRYDKNSDKLHFVDSATAHADATPQLWRDDMQEKKRHQWGFNNRKVMECLAYDLDFGLKNGQNYSDSYINENPPKRL